MRSDDPHYCSHRRIGQVVTLSMWRFRVRSSVGVQSPKKFGQPVGIPRGGSYLCTEGRHRVGWLRCPFSSVNRTLRYERRGQRFESVKGYNEEYLPQHSWRQPLKAIYTAMYFGKYRDVIKRDVVAATQVQFMGIERCSAADGKKLSWCGDEKEPGSSPGTQQFVYKIKNVRIMHSHEILQALVGSLYAYKTITKTHVFETT